MKELLFVFLMGISSIIMAQSPVKNLIDANPHEQLDNIKVEKLYSDERGTSFLIWVSDSVRPHIHKEHTETLYMVSGEGIFWLDGKKYLIKKGDFFTVPLKKVHAYKRKGDEISKFLSIQAPEFHGKDRYFVE